MEGLKIFRCLFLLTLFSSPASANPLSIVTGEFAPFAGESLEGGGPTTQLVVALFAQADIPASVEFRPWKRGYLEALAGKYAATFPYSESAERKKLFYYSDPLDVGRIHFYASASIGLKVFNNFEGFDGKELCMPVGHNLFDSVKKAVAAKQLTVLRLNSMEQCFEMVRLGRTDMTLVRHEVADAILGEQSQVVALYPPLKTITEHVIFPKSYPNSQALLKRFNAVLHKRNAKL